MMPPHESSESDRAARNEPSDRFDAYHGWLGIPPSEQPANHYRLLGINLFESAWQVIGNAADQRMTYLKTFSAGQHSTLSQRLLNEVSAARVCLLSEPKKRAYDDQLRKQTAPRSVTQPPPVPPCPPAGSQPGDFIVDARPPVHPRTKRRSIARKEWAVGAVAMLLLFIVGGVMIPSIIDALNPSPPSAGPGLGNENGNGGEDPTPHITNSIGMKLVLIPVGEFDMGSPANEEGRNDDEGPVHQVRITKSFFLGVTEVTQGQWEEVMDTRPWVEEKWTKSGAEYAVSSVSWDDADHFCQTLSAFPAEKSAGRAYGLPTEAEWEYACRAGSRTRYYFGAKALGLGSNAQYDQNTSNVGEKYAHPVGLKLPNDWGLYDMHGNVWEWCQDRYGKGYYANSRVDNPAGPSTGSNRVFRGGSWYSDPARCRSAIRSELAPDIRHRLFGFRVALVSEESGKEEPPQAPGETAVDRPTEIPLGGLVENFINVGVDQAGEDIGGSKGGEAGGEADQPVLPTDPAGTEEVGPPEPSDGVPDDDDAFPTDPNEQSDNDGDGIGDNADTDDDNDGISDEDELANGTAGIVSLLLEAWVQINRGNIEVGRDLLKAAIKEEDSADIRGRFSLGLLDALNAHEWKKAHAQFTVCIRRQPAHVPSLNNLALLNIRLKHTTSAMSNWRAALEASPQPPAEILHNLARLQHLAVMLNRRDSRSLDQLCETATAGGGSLPSIDSSDGWSYMASDGPGLGSSNPDDYVDHCCITCDGLRKVRCPNRTCAQGTVRRFQRQIIGRNPYTDEPVWRDVPIRVPCGVCKGQGCVTCPSCKGSGRN